MSTEVVFNGVARLEITRIKRLDDGHWVNLQAFDEDNNEVGVVCFFPSRGRSLAHGPNVTSDFHIAITKQEG